jgi:hypothetical protein
MQLHLKFQQVILENWVRRHPQANSKELFEHDSFVIIGLWDGLFTGLMTYAIGKIAIVNHLM